MTAHTPCLHCEWCQFNLKWHGEQVSHYMNEFESLELAFEEIDRLRHVNAALLEALEDWESSTNHHVTHLSLSGQVTKEKTRAAISAAKGKDGMNKGSQRCVVCGFKIWLDENSPGLCACRTCGYPGSYPGSVPRKCWPYPEYPNICGAHAKPLTGAVCEGAANAAIERTT